MQSLFLETALPRLAIVQRTKIERRWKTKEGNAIVWIIVSKDNGEYNDEKKSGRAVAILRVTLPILLISVAQGTDTKKRRG